MKATFTVILVVLGTMVYAQDTQEVVYDCDSIRFNRMVKSCMELSEKQGRGYEEWQCEVFVRNNGGCRIYRRMVWFENGLPTDTVIKIIR